MSDTTTELEALAAQVRALSGDLDRRFELADEQFTQLSTQLQESDVRIEQLRVGLQQLNGRLETLTTSRKQAMPFIPALGGSWVGGNTSPAMTLPGSGGPFLVAKGVMPVVLPSLARVTSFRVAVRAGLNVGDADLAFFSTTTISLQRTNATVAEPVAQLSGDLARVGERHATPIAGRELVDPDLFKYSITMEVLVPNLLNTPFPLPQGFAVLEKFHVDCVIS